MKKIFECNESLKQFSMTKKHSGSFPPLQPLIKFSFCSKEYTSKNIINIIFKINKCLDEINN